MSVALSRQSSPDAAAFIECSFNGFIDRCNYTKELLMRDILLSSWLRCNTTSKVYMKSKMDLHHIYTLIDFFLGLMTWGLCLEFRGLVRDCSVLRDKTITTRLMYLLCLLHFCWHLLPCRLWFKFGLGPNGVFSVYGACSSSFSIDFSDNTRW